LKRTRYEVWRPPTVERTPTSETRNCPGERRTEPALENGKLYAYKLEKLKRGTYETKA
jgi:hypothetical protein